MTNEFAIALLRQDIEDSKNGTPYWHNETGIEALDLAIKALEQQPSEDCISREQAIRATYGFERYSGIDEAPYEYAESILRDLPSVTPTRPKGKWIILDECANEGVYCSECHKKVFKLEFSHTMKWRNFKYCPNCGADMRGDSE